MPLFRNVGEFAYANFEAARTQKVVPKLQEQICRKAIPPVLRRILASAAFLTQFEVEEVAWGLISGRAVTQDGGRDRVERGTDPRRDCRRRRLGSYTPEFDCKPFFKAQKLPTFKSHGFHDVAFSASGAGRMTWFSFL